jgi:hypothetical protein
MRTTNVVVRVVCVTHLSYHVVRLVSIFKCNEYFSAITHFYATKIAH